MMNDVNTTSSEPAMPLPCPPLSATLEQLIKQLLGEAIRSAGYGVVSSVSAERFASIAMEIYDLGESRAYRQPTSKADQAVVLAERDELASIVKALATSEVLRPQPPQSLLASFCDVCGNAVAIDGDHGEYISCAWWRARVWSEGQQS